MDSSSSTGEEPNRKIWAKISGIFGPKEENLEKAIIDAQEEGELKEEEGTMLLSVLEFDSMQVGEIMTPRADMVSLSAKSTVNQVVEKIIESGHSRIPIYDGTTDNIIGMAYAKDLLPCLLNPADHHDNISSVLRTVHFVPETKICNELFQEFRKTKNHIAIVTDEYGGTAGIVTIEDLIEIIVGEIEDEYDAPKDAEISAVGKDAYLVQGRTFLEDLEPIGLKINSEEVDTIGGYLSLLSDSIPEEGEEFELEDWKVTVKEADIKHVKTLIIEKIAEEIPQEELQ